MKSRFAQRLGRLPAQPQPEQQPAPGQELERLREHLHQALGDPGLAVGTALPNAEGAQASLEAMQFEQRSTAIGPVWCRQIRHHAQRRVGRFELATALEPDPRVLSLLALEPELAQTSFERALILDTETTGLGGAGAFAFLVGICRFEGATLVVEQYLLEGPEQEPAMLLELDRHLADASVLVSFNGRSFDWPLLCSRYVMNQRKAPEPPIHLDLLHLARRVHGHRMRRCTLKHLENEVIDFRREGDIDGAQVAATYLHYLRTGDTSLLDKVVMHNEWDVVSTALLLGLYGKPDPALDCRDIIGLARTYKRAKALPEAKRAADAAVARTGDPRARTLRGDIHRTLGNSLEALADWERANEAIDDPDLRLRLAKLYEHFCKEPARALEMVERGVGETADAEERRRARLQRKLARQ